MTENEELQLLNEIERNEWVRKPLSSQERQVYQNSVRESKPLLPVQKSESLKG
jgi:hypothetical protein